LKPVVVPDREEGVGEDAREKGVFGGEGGTDGRHFEERLLDVACERLKFNVQYRLEGERRTLSRRSVFKYEIRSILEEGIVYP
jgi:hypothetical protein